MARKKYPHNPEQLELPLEHPKHGRYTYWPLVQRKLPPTRPPVIPKDDAVIPIPTPEVETELSPLSTEPTTTGSHRPVDDDGTATTLQTSVENTAE